MSQFVEGTTKITDQESLICALVEMGYSRGSIEIHEEAHPLYGYQDDVRADKAHIIVKRYHIGGLSNDMGFRKEPNGTYTALVSEYDSRSVDGKFAGYLDQKHKATGGFVKEVTTRAAINAAEKQMVKRGYKTKRVTEGRKVRLLCTR